MHIKVPAVTMQQILWTQCKVSYRFACPTAKRTGDETDQFDSLISYEGGCNLTPDYHRCNVGSGLMRTVMHFARTKTILIFIYLTLVTFGTLGCVVPSGQYILLLHLVFVHLIHVHMFQIQ